MPIDLGIRFPTEAEAMRKQCEVEKHLTPHERLLSVVDTLAAVEALSIAGGVREAQLKFQQEQEDEWRRRMMEVIKKHVSK